MYIKEIYPGMTVIDCSEKELPSIVDDLSKQAAVIYDAVREDYVNKCENEKIREIFLTWWGGGSIYNDEFKSKYSKEDFDIAHSLIMEVISMGLG